MKISLFKILFIIFAVQPFVWGANSPKRIVSLAPSITYSLYALGLENQLIGITQFCPKGKTKKEIVGTMSKPNIEKIIALNPDIVIMTKEGNSLATFGKLKRLGINCVVTENDDSFLKICSNFIYLAKHLGKTKSAEEIVAHSKEKLNKIEEKIKNANKARIFWELGANPLFTSGGKSFINDYSVFAGAKNIFSDFNKRYSRISLEEVLKRNPEIIIIFNMGDMTNQEKYRWEKYQHLSAVKNNRVYLIETEEILIPTPENFASSAKKIAELIHPEYFNEK
jgi:iron complex transport system substrate-binding protein